MASLRLAVLFVSLLAVRGGNPTNAEWKAKQAAAASGAAEAKANAGKMAAVNKVIDMLKLLSKNVVAEGEKEAGSYNKFACFCKSMQLEKNDAIQAEKDAKATLISDIGVLETGRKTDDTSLKTLNDDINQANDDMTAAKTTNKNELKTYNEKKTDLSNAVSAITNAMATLKGSKPSLLQMQSAKDSVQEVLAMADALGMGVDTMQGPMAALIQQAPEVEMENYKFHSSGVIGILEGLLKQFRTKKNTADSTEVQRLQAHDMLMQTKTDLVKAKTLETDQTKKARADKIEDIAQKSKELSTQSSNLMDDSQYLEDLYANCKRKAQTWDQRSTVRADELSAITAATTIIETTVSAKTSKATLRFAQRGVSIRLAQAVARDEDAMDSLEEAAEEKEGSAPIAFLQRRSISKHAGDTAVESIQKLLFSVGSRTKSTALTALAAQINNAAPKGMEKIKTLIQELIKRLEAEAAGEATQKGWCDKATSDATTRQKTTAQEVDNLNDSMAKLEAKLALLKEELATLAKDIKELTAAQATADALRANENTENAATVKAAGEGKVAVENAIKILTDFYAGVKSATVPTLISVSSSKAVQAPPDAGFKNDEANQGSQSASTGVLGMLDVILSDFDRTIKETKKGEAESLQDHTAFTATTTKSKTEKIAIKAKMQTESDDADTERGSQKTSLSNNMNTLTGVVTELLELKKTCVDTGMSYAERVARREDEVQALNKALCILKAFANYGPNAGTDACN